jgi:hypothetical protein
MMNNNGFERKQSKPFSRLYLCISYRQIRLPGLHYPESGGGCTAPKGIAVGRRGTFWRGGFTILSFLIK